MSSTHFIIFLALVFAYLLGFFTCAMFFASPKESEHHLSWQKRKDPSDDWDSM